MTSKPGIILVVDDEAAIRSLLIRKLADEGYRCEEAGNTDEALNKLQNNTVELVLLDLKMPGKSGVELLPEIKLRHPDTAVIMATATTDINTAIRCMKQGAYDYITKPFNLDEVTLSISRALAKRSLELENRDYQQHLEQRIEAQAKRIRASFFNAVTALAYALEAKDEYTSGHSQRVADMAVATAKEMNLPRDSIEKIRLAGLIHDIGKIGVKESILSKPSGLTEEEFQNIKSHPEIGERILNPVVDDKEILMMVRHHHERYDGAGYPDRLKGEGIPLGARILAVADTYDAMTSGRPYRKATNVASACTEVERGKGTQFDPKAADAFLRTKNLVESVV